MFPSLPSCVNKSPQHLCELPRSVVMPKFLLILFQDNLFTYSNSLLVGLLCSGGDAGGKATKEMFLELLTQSIQKGLYLFF